MLERDNKTIKTLIVMSEGLESWKRGMRKRRTLMIMSENFEARKGDQDDKNTYDYVRIFDELENGH